MDTPNCCNKETDFIGVTDRGENKYYCNECYKIQYVKVELKKVAPGGATRLCVHL